MVIHSTSSPFTSLSFGCFVQQKIRSTPSILSKRLERQNDNRSSATDVTFPPTVSIQVSKFIDREDPRASCPEMKEAIMSEVKDLLDRGTIKITLKKELSEGANALTERLVLAIKFNDDREIKYMARYFIGGHRNQLKHYMVHGVQTLQASSARLFLVLIAAHNYEEWTSDVKQAYLQSPKTLERRVFINETAPNSSSNQRNVSDCSARFTACVTLVTFGTNP